MVDERRIGAGSMQRLLAGWSTGVGPLHKKLANAFRLQLTAGTLRAGDILPSQRELAKTLAVSRSTVGLVYDTLKSEGWLGTRQGGTTWIRTTSQRNSPEWHGERLASYAAPETPLDFSSGTVPASPILNGLIRGNWLEQFEDALSEDGFLPSGLPEVVELIAQYFSKSGLPTTPGQVVLTNGAHHGLTLVANTVIEAGDIVITEDPTYRGALDLFSARGAKIIGVKTDQDGPIPEDLNAILNHFHPRLAYFMPTAHNVTGVSWPRSRRKRISDLMKLTDCLVVEDASTIDLDDSCPGYFAKYLGLKNTVVLGSVTKLFWAGLRVGWIRGPRILRDAVTRARLSQDLSGSIPSQLFVASCLPLAETARRLRNESLNLQRNLMRDLINDSFPSWKIHPCHAGSSIWINTGINTLHLAAKLARDSIIVSGGETFSPTGNFPTWLRLPLSKVNVFEQVLPQIKKAVAKLSD